MRARELRKPLNITEEDDDKLVHLGRYCDAPREIVGDTSGHHGAHELHGEGLFLLQTVREYLHIIELLLRHTQVLAIRCDCAHEEK